MNFNEAINSFFKNYVNFEGRSSKSALWWGVLLVFSGSIVAAILDSILFDSGPGLMGLWSLAILLPSLALYIRRLHDIGKPGIYVLFYFIPLAGIILFIIWNLEESAPENEWGPIPLK